MTLANEAALKNAIVEIPFSAVAYPERWGSLADCPQILYAVGDISLLQGRKIAIVGSRRTPASALKVGGEIAARLSEQMTVVTGVADGGDTAAIEGALKAGGKIVCLLAGGFSALPQCNLPLLERVAKKGLLLSPHPFATQVRSFSYPYRNKLLALLSDGVLVLGAGEKSGALLTAGYAREAGLPVFALPYPPNSHYGCGCNRLIKEGGRLVEGAEDIAAYYRIDLREKSSLSLTAEEEKVYLALKERGECHAQELAALVGIPSFKLIGLLSALQVKGGVVPLGGNRFAAI